jgi:Skp family chaperone for outer membrane proteins
MPARRTPTTTSRLAALALLALATTACATGYGARGWSGGYSDTRVDDTHYYVTFHGNGHASEDRVWNFWFYRCAELTLEKGFRFFDVRVDKRGSADQSFLEDPTSADRLRGRLSERRARPQGLVVPAGYVYTYVPAQKTTLWTAKGTVAMYERIPAGRQAFSAERVVEMLGPYVKSNGSEGVPERTALLRAAVVRPGADDAPVAAFPDGARVGYVDMKRLVATVAEARAAVARVRAAYVKRQAALDAGKAKLEKLRSARDAELDPARKAALARDLDALGTRLQQARTTFQAQLDAEEKRVVDQISARAAPLVERARSAQHLDKITEDAEGGLWDADVTDEVIRLYDESYPVPAAS